MSARIDVILPIVALALERYTANEFVIGAFDSAIENFVRCILQNSLNALLRQIARNDLSSCATALRPAL